jgi:hypothetical protein
MAEKTTLQGPAGKILPEGSVEVKEKPKEAEQVTKLWYTVGTFTDGNASVSSYSVPASEEELRQVWRILGAVFSMIPSSKDRLLQKIEFHSF